MGYRQRSLMRRLIDLLEELIVVVFNLAIFVIIVSIIAIGVQMHLAYA